MAAEVVSRNTAFYKNMTSIVRRKGFRNLEIKKKSNHLATIEISYLLWVTMEPTWVKINLKKQIHICCFVIFMNPTSEDVQINTKGPWNSQATKNIDSKKGTLPETNSQKPLKIGLLPQKEN